MKRLITILFLLMFMGCHYSSNIIINKRKTPVIVIAIDKENSSVMFRDGDNKVFTLYDTPTTGAISKSLIIGDTVRQDENDKIVKYGTSGDF